MKNEIKVKAKVDFADENDISLEFGSTRADMWFSGSGKIQRALQLKQGDRVEIMIKKLEVRK